jgi:hypothetical protein
VNEQVAETFIYAAVTSAAEAVMESKAFIAAVNRCATQKEGHVVRAV